VEKEGEVVFDGELHRDTYDHLVGTHHTAVRRPGGTRRALEPKTDGPRGVAVEAEQHAPRSKGFKVQEELLEAAEDVRDWLEDRRASSAPREMIDGREGRHRWTLMAKIATVAGEA
jgi:hypothetical protein